MIAYGSCWKAWACGMHCKRFLSNVNASVCGNSIKIPNRAWDKYWASAVFWDTRLKRRANDHKQFEIHVHLQDEI